MGSAGTQTMRSAGTMSLNRRGGGTIQASQIMPNRTFVGRSSTQKHGARAMSSQ